MSVSIPVKVESRLIVSGLVAVFILILFPFDLIKFTASSHVELFVSKVWYFGLVQELHHR